MKKRTDRGQASGGEPGPEAYNAPYVSFGVLGWLSEAGVGAAKRSQD